MSTSLLCIVTHSVEERHGPYYSLGVASEHGGYWRLGNHSIIRYLVEFALSRVCHSVLGRVCHSILGRVCYSVLGRVYYLVLGRVCYSVLGTRHLVESLLGRVCYLVLGTVFPRYSVNIADRVLSPVCIQNR